MCQACAVALVKVMELLEAVVWVAVAQLRPGLVCGGVGACEAVPARQRQQLSSLVTPLQPG